MTNIGLYTTPPPPDLQHYEILRFPQLLNFFSRKKTREIGRFQQAVRLFLRLLLSFWGGKRRFFSEGGYFFTRRKKSQWDYPEEENGKKNQNRIFDECWRLVDFPSSFLKEIRWRKYLNFSFWVRCWLWYLETLGWSLPARFRCFLGVVCCRYCLRRWIRWFRVLN